MAFVTCDGREYTIALTAEYWVHVYGDGDELDAEDVAWDVLDKALRESDANEYEIYETIESYTGLMSSNFKISVNFVIYSVAHDISDAYDNAVKLVENISTPANVQLVGTSQTDFIKVGKPVLIVHGENV